jgi:hypothetical protein
MTVASTVFKCTQIINGHGAGWTESFYSYASGRGSARSQFADLMAERDDLLGLGYDGPFARVTNYNNRRDTQFFQAGLAAGSHLDGDTPWQALLIRIIGANGMHRSYLPHGFPDDWFKKGDWTPDGNASASLFRFFAKLKQGSWALVGQDPTKPIKPIVAISGGGLATFAAPHGYPDNTRVYAFRVKDALGKNIKGQFTVLNSPSATTAQLSGWPVARSGDSGGLREVNVVDSVIVDAFVERAALRKVGRPFGLYRGRARRRG